MTALVKDIRSGSQCCECGSGECLLLGRCLAGDQTAWEEFFADLTPDLVRLVRYFLGRQSSDDQLVEELVARVWYVIVDNDSRILRRYDPDWSNSIGKYLAGVVCRVVRGYLRAEHSRRNRQWPRGCRSGLAYRPSGFDVGLLLNEFAETLNAKEMAFLEDYLLTHPSAGHHPTSIGRLSAANVRQRCRRLRLKLEEFLDVSEDES